MAKIRTYSEELKKEAVELSYNSDKTCKEITKDLGISYNNLIKWRKEYKDKGYFAFSGQGQQKITPEQEEIKKLKKAGAIFSEQPK